MVTIRSYKDGLLARIAVVVEESAWAEGVIPSRWVVAANDAGDRLQGANRVLFGGGEICLLYELFLAGMVFEVD